MTSRSDDIVHVTAGVVGVTPIDWQNRPTFQQAVNFTSDRSSTTNGSVLPTTGMPVTLAGLALLLLVAAGAAREFAKRRT